MEDRSPKDETQKGGPMKDGHYFNKVEDEIWVQDGKYHREDGPAVIWSNGPQFWFQNGEYHREDGPAIMWNNGDKEFWLYDIPYPQIKNDVLWRIEVQRLKRKEKEII